MYSFTFKLVILIFSHCLPNTHTLSHPGTLIITADKGNGIVAGLS